VARVYETARVALGAEHRKQILESIAEPFTVVVVNSSMT